MINKKHKKTNFLLLGMQICLSLGIIMGFKQPKSVLSAETINIIYGPLDFSISIDSLETYAKTGEINRELKFYTQSLNEADLIQFQNLLNQTFHLNQVTVYRFTRLPIAEQLLKELGKIIKTHPQRNGFYPIRAALGKAAANPEGWTIIDVMHQFPGQTIRIDAQDLLNLQDEIISLTKYRQAAIQTIEEQAKNEIANKNLIVTNLKNLSQEGELKFTKQTVVIEHDVVRQTNSGLKGSYSFEVDFYLPETQENPAPLVIISHGFGSLKENFIYLAEHLASRGFAVAIPEHIGSNLSYRKNLLAGNLNTLLSPIEYLDRPREISYLLDKLETLSVPDQLRQQINLNQIGVIGNSFGATTALSLAGAEINTARLQQQCQREQVNLNISALLQCRARNLPPQNYNLRDQRIKATLASMPLTSLIFGVEGVEKIETPTLILAGSNDVVTPVVAEQIHPFIWLKNTQKYLAMIQPGTHFSTSQQSATGTQFIPKAIIGENAEIGRDYLKGLSIAFFEVYLRDNSEYKPYLSANYAKSISTNAMSLSLIQQLEPQNLEVNYGSKPPLEIMPKTIISKSSVRNKTVLKEIQQTGKLKVAVRKDAPFFGYIDKQGNWNGYCFDLIHSFKNHLKNELNLANEIEIIPIPSSLDDRFDLIENNTVHLECGPNTIRADLKQVTFSEPFFITGTHFLTKTNQAENFQPGGNLAGIKTGVLKKSLTEQFIKTKYPQIDEVYFQGPRGRSEAIKALHKNQIELFANDGILSLAEVYMQNLNLENYTLIPKIPLTCDYYGLALPNNDSQWRNTVNSFLNNHESKEVWDKWFKDLLPDTLINLNYCLN